MKPGIAIRGPLATPTAIRSALAVGMTPFEITNALMRQFDGGQPAIRSDADAAWVAGQLLKRRRHLERVVVPLLKQAGIAVDAAHAAQWVDTAERDSSLIHVIT